MAISWQLTAKSRRRHEIATRSKNMIVFSRREAIAALSSRLNRRVAPRTFDRWVTEACYWMKYQSLYSEGDLDTLAELATFLETRSRSYAAWHEYCQSVVNQSLNR